MTTLLYLVRHGQSKHNVLRIVQGGKNPKSNTLYEGGVRQAQKLSDEFSEINFDACYSSPIYRALQTARILVKDRKIKINKEKQLREKNQGSFVGLPVNEHIKAYKNWDDLTEDERLDYKLVPDEESQRELRIRAMKVLQQIAEKHKNCTTIIVTHGGFMRSVFTFLENKSFKDRLKFDNCGFMCLEYKRRKFKILETSKLHKVTKEEFAGEK